MFTHNLEPILIDFGFLALRWYSLAYIIGVLIGWWYGKKIITNITLKKENKFNLKDFDDLITYLIISIIIGGRIGYIVFYNFSYYLSNPLEVIKIWQGGMSFHGALIGIIFGTYIYSAKRKLETFFLLDVIACVAPIGIFFGRIANFINSELVGKISNVQWSVVFPTVDMMPRHPSQLYEAFFEGVVLFIIMNFIISKKNYEIGTCSYLFLIFYGLFRIFSEFFREPDPQLGYLFGAFSMGMLLSLVMIFFGMLIYKFLKKKNEI